MEDNASNTVTCSLIFCFLEYTWSMISLWCNKIKKSNITRGRAKIETSPRSCHITYCIP